MAFLQAHTESIFKAISSAYLLVRCSCLDTDPPHILLELGGYKLLSGVTMQGLDDWDLPMLNIVHWALFGR